jgi:hypothetical protein
VKDPEDNLHYAPGRLRQRAVHDNVSAASEQAFSATTLISALFKPHSARILTPTNTRMQTLIFFSTSEELSDQKFLKIVEITVGDMVDRTVGAESSPDTN